MCWPGCTWLQNRKPCDEKRDKTASSIRKRSFFVKLKLENRNWRYFTFMFREKMTLVNRMRVEAVYIWNVINKEFEKIFKQMITSLHVFFFNTFVWYLFAVSCLVLVLSLWDEAKVCALPLSDIKFLNKLVLLVFQYNEVVFFERNYWPLLILHYSTGTRQNYLMPYCDTYRIWSRTTVDCERFSNTKYVVLLWTCDISVRQ